MFRKLGGSATLWKPKNPHSLEYLKYLHGVIVKNEKVNDSNRKILVEALRAMAEILIWGDQNDASVFDFFLERQMLLHFLKIMDQGSSSINVQLLQTLNILFENIRHETSLYFLLSNNHVNSILTHKFDLNNDEIMAYYISFLKTLSFKLNACTVHFFFNEATKEFPLLTEALKLFDSTESMVRIAVRNIVLNVVRVKDEAMIDFVRTHTKIYLSELVDSLVGLAIDLDVFVRSAENVQANRERLRDKVDDLIDLVHYIGELLDVDAMAEWLSHLVSSRFLMPLLLNSLAPRRDNHAVLLTPVSSLFFFAQFLLVVTHRPTIQGYLSAFLFDDPSILRSHWIRQGESFRLQNIEPPSKTPENRVFFESLLSAFDASQKDDYLSFYGLMLIYAMFQNNGDVGELLATVNFPFRSRHSSTQQPPQSSQDTRGRALTELAVEATEDSYREVVDRLQDLKQEEMDDEVLVDEPRPPSASQTSESDGPRSRFMSAAEELEPSPATEKEPKPQSCDYRLIEALSSIIAAVGNEQNRVRPITLELACLVIRQILLSVDDEQLHSSLTSLCGKARKQLVDQLSLYVNSENLFLEWFEDEYAEFEVNHVKLDVIGYEMLLPPATTPMSGLPLHKRLFSGFEERLRTTMLFYFHVRKLERDMTGEMDGELPVRAVSEQEPVTIGDCINLANSDLLACTVVMVNPTGKSSDRQARFLVTDRLQLILVEPDSRKAGWAIVRFAGLLQDTQITGDSSDSRALHVVVEGQPSRKRQAVLKAKFIFDDHIRCMAAKQRLTKGRQIARGLKLHAICDLLGVPKIDVASPRVNPFKISKGCAPGSVRKTQSTSSSTSSYGRFAPLRSSTPSRDPGSTPSAIPEDPSPAPGSIRHV
ncbi:unnamed protein product [Caenorhabditis auriculariae]|uniref:FPL domain-containing protein n=1 Tax=Caenorhabditis auriculariae TaxID=2777116 RepID=A0A8S1GPZ3_9PELO|nr:unnamed protein product [Caenorhabditis auriculariae]